MIIKIRYFTGVLGHSVQVNADHYDYSTASNTQKMGVLEDVYSNVFNNKDK